MDTIKVSTLWQGKRVDGQFVASKIVSIGVTDEDLRKALTQSPPPADR